MKNSAPALAANSPVPGHKPGQALKFLAAVVFVAFALPLALLAGYLAWRQYRVLTSWPAVDAVVTKADWTTTTDRASRPPATAYGARFTFRYTAAGHVYESKVDLGYTSPARSEIERWMEQMPVGSHRRVRYDPRNPTTISLVTDFTPISFAAPFTLAKWAGVIAAMCLVVFLLGARAGKRKSVVGSR